MVRRIKRALQAKADSFQKRYAAIEASRLALAGRLYELAPRAQEHPAHRNVQTLLGTRFRKATMAQRVAILQSAEWLLNLLETLTKMV